MTNNVKEKPFCQKGMSKFWKNAIWGYQYKTYVIVINDKNISILLLVITIN